MAKNNLTSILLAILTLTLLSPTSASVIGYYKNNCGFTTWAHTSRGGGGDSSTVPIYPGQEYWTPIQADAGGEGVTLKVDNNPQLAHPYQIEFSSRDGRVWYDLSSVDGSPFFTNRRFLQVGDPGQCPWLFCDVNQSGCEWPVQRDCAHGGPVYFWLC